MQTDLINETRRQAEICNACRYCEGYCSVFPALHRERTLSDADITQLANLCHNCRGCYYACQYTAPHEFDLNLPGILAEVRRDSWEQYVWPQPLTRRFHTHGGAITLGVVIAITLVLIAIELLRPAEGNGFYAVLSHSVMVAIALPAFAFPVLCLAIGVRRYWQAVGGQPLKRNHFKTALQRVIKMTDLAAGHGEGCNFEAEDRFSHARRFAHQAIMYGFLLCFAATTTGTVMHYALDMPAPYPLWSLPKLFGLTGGILLTIGCGWMMILKSRSDQALGDRRAWGGDMAFVALLGATGFSGLALYAFGETSIMQLLLALHLGTVFAFFLLSPFTKMAHGAFRLAALLRDAQSPKA